MKFSDLNTFRQLKFLVENQYDASVNTIGESINIAFDRVEVILNEDGTWDYDLTGFDVN